MSLAFEGNTDLAFDTGVMREYGKKYGDIADDLREMSKKLDSCLTELQKSGWTTPAGTAFHELVKTNWEENIEKYAALLDTLEGILQQAAAQYDSLATNHIEKTKV